MFSKYIFFLAIIFAAVIPFVADAAVLYFLPQAQQVYLGDSFVVEVRLDTEGEEINAAEASLKYLTNLLEVVDVSMGGSVLDIAVKTKRADEEGGLLFAGGAPQGFKGDGLVGRITFSAKSKGEAALSFADNSRVLLNDGSGTPAPLVFLEGTYGVVEKPEGWINISSPTHSDQNKWGKGNTLHLHWDLESNAEYSYLLSRDPLAEPDETPDRPQGDLLWTGDMEYAYLEDGIYYFNLKRGLKDAAGQLTWGPTITYRAMVDITSPENFEPKSAKIEGKNYVVFSAFDKTSGIDHYEVFEQPRNFFGKPKNGAGSWKKGESPYLLADQKLNSNIKVRAVDGAGNEIISEIIPKKKIFPQILSAIIIFALLIGFIILAAKRKPSDKAAKKK